MTLQDLLREPPRYAPNTPWRGLWAVAATAAILIGAQMLAALTFPMLTGMAARELPMRPLGSAGAGSAVSTLLLWLVLTQAAAILLVIGAAHMFNGRPREVLRLGANNVGLGTLLHAVLLMAVTLGSYNAVVYLLWPSNMLDDLQLFAGFIRSDAWLLATLAIGIGAPLMEELLFRGFLQSALAQSALGFWPAAVITTAGWTILHWGYSAVGLTEVFLIGMYFSWLLWKTGSLLPALFCHALYNSGLILVLRFAELPVNH
jgi:membrane protease YdiL (CAAX protease family)